MIIVMPSYVLISSLLVYFYVDKKKISCVVLPCAHRLDPPHELMFIKKILIIV